MKKSALLLLSLLSLIAGGLLGYWSWSDKAPAAEQLQALALPDIDQQLRHGSEWLGKIVVLNHWATWCGPCREEIPLLAAFNEAMAHRGVQVLGVAHDRLEATRRFGDEVGLNYPSLVAIVEGHKLLAAHGNTHAGALPYTVVFDRNGNIATTKLGLLTMAELQAMVEPLLLRPEA